MAHQSLYRKYRPQTFDDVVGQQHIERTLRNAVADGTVAHAYLFTGPRGTGKTTTARILAKALNCQLGPTAEPDGTCEDCIEIAEGRHPDVYELDAASRTGVDNVREEIIGRVNFAPQRGRYKVYIIDEVHMLSTAAFNALLKTLEEPPSHVVFILATTHPHKVPDTIHSRCQRFDFHRIGVEEIVGRLRIICDGEGFEVPDAALALMARHASGGMRDAITTLEQLASFTGGSIGLADVEGLLGEVDSAALFEIAGLVAHRDIAGCFRWVARFAEDGTDLAEFVRELTGHVRNLYLIAAVRDAEGLIDATAEERGRLSSQAAEFGGPDRLSRVLDLLGELGSELRWSSDQRLSLEVALTRMARPTGEMTLEALAERVEMLERMRSLGGPAEAGAEASGSGAQSTARGAVFAKSPDASAGAAASSAGGASGLEPLGGAAGASEAGALAEPAGASGAEPSGGASGRSDAQGSKKASAESERLKATWDAAAHGLGADAPASSGPTAAPEPKPAATPAGEAAPITLDVAPSGALDRAAARRAWPAALMEIKKLRPARSSQFADIEVDIDRDGITLVLEFPADQSFAMELAEEPEMRDMLKIALAAVLGSAPPFRMQLGRGAVQDVAAPPAHSGHPADVADVPHLPAEDYDEGPEPEYYETAPGVVEPSAPAAAGRGPQTAVERLLLNELGGEIVAEHAADPAETPDAEDLSALDEVIETDCPDTSDPGLFDNDGED